MSSGKNDGFSQRVKIFITIAVVTVLTILLLIKAVKVLLLIFTGVMVAIFFHRIADWIEKWTKLNRSIALPAAVILVLGIFTVLFFLLRPEVSRQVNKLQDQVPEAAYQLENKLKETETGRFIVKQLPFDISSAGSNVDSAMAAADSISTNTSAENNSTSVEDKEKKSFKFTDTLKAFFSTTFGIMGDLYVILLLAMFFIANPDPYKKGIVLLVPQKQRSRATEVLNTVGTNLRLWLFGKILSMLVVTVLTLIGLWLLGVPLYFTLAILAGLLSFIPNFGPIISAVPAFLVAYVNDPTLGLWVILLYVIVQVIESNLITPFIMKKRIFIPIAMVLFSQILLAVFVGFLGMIFATPIIVTFMVIIQMLYIEDYLGDRDIEVKAEDQVSDKL